MIILSRILLFPLTILYAVIIVIWNFYWRIIPGVKLPCKVISVGNIVAGGAGKTPLVIYIAKLAVKAGLKTAVVARGYKRREKGTIEVNENSGWEKVGDEPLEVFRAVPGIRVYAGKSKTEAARQAAADGAQIIIIDDGFQHRKLARDIDIVCLDSAEPFGPAWLLPSGRLREPRFALKRADALIFTSFEKGNDFIDNMIESREYKIFYSKSKIAHFKKLDNNSVIECDIVGQQKTIAFCGLANPEKFRNSLVKAGIVPQRFKYYDDHHCYSQFDIEILTAMARHEKADSLITTRKDAVKLDSIAFGDVPVYYALIDIAVSDETEFRKMVGI
jgi:tetraacyldisaccharide 4'-kinase